MSKFDSLWQFVKNSDQNTLILTFENINTIIGFPVDHSFLKYKKDLEAFGYQVKKISIKKQFVEFTKIK